MAWMKKIQIQELELQSSAESLAEEPYHEVILKSFKKKKKKKSTAELATKMSKSTSLTDATK